MTAISDYYAKLIATRDPNPAEQAEIDAGIEAMKAELRAKELKRLASLKGGYCKRHYEPTGTSVVRRGKSVGAN